MVCSPLYFSVCVCVILIPRQCSAKRAGPAEKCKHLRPQVPEERKRDMEPIAFPWLVSLIWRKKRKTNQEEREEGFIQIKFLKSNTFFFFSPFSFLLLPPPNPPSPCHLSTVSSVPEIFIFFLISVTGSAKHGDGREDGMAAGRDRGLWERGMKARQFLPKLRKS